MDTICICGAGTMGSGIAQVSATAGFRTIVYDVSTEVIQKTKLQIEKDFQVLVDKKKLTTEEKEKTLDKLVFTSNIRDCVADLIIEAIVEKIEPKVSLFQQLSLLNANETILASNTSSLSVSAIAKELQVPDRVAGLHFFNPAPLMKLVEVVKGAQTAEGTVAKLVKFVKALGKTPVVCNDAPGFIVNRVARPYYIESLRLVEEGLVDFATLDRLMENQGFKMGPFKLMDLIGNDVNYAVSCSVYEQLNKPVRLKPSFIQKEKVYQGELGKKSGKGYYNY